jgi:hypothetical protein
MVLSPFSAVVVDASFGAVLRRVVAENQVMSFDILSYLCSIATYFPLTMAPRSETDLMSSLAIA